MDYGRSSLIWTMTAISNKKIVLIFWYRKALTLWVYYVLCLAFCSKGEDGNWWMSNWPSNHCLKASNFFFSRFIAEGLYNQTCPWKRYDKVIKVLMFSIRKIRRLSKKCEPEGWLSSTCTLTTTSTQEINFTRRFST